MKENLTYFLVLWLLSCYED